jgi:hypothetical protein|tara:strand:- start:972 stop:1403 length:432 start_codon:yes stop_codon:yes gene_type:complete
MNATKPDGIKFDINSWKIKVRERRNNRMRLQINLTKDEGLAYKNFAEVCKPEEVTDADFMKTIFLTGIEAMNQQLADMVRKYAEDNREELAASGITVLEGDDGKIKLAETSKLDAEVSGAPSISDGVLHDEEIGRIMDSEKDA